MPIRIENRKEYEYEREKKQQNMPVQKGGAHVAKSGSNVSTVSAQGGSAGADSEASGMPKRNKYADKMNQKRAGSTKACALASALRWWCF